MKSAPQPAVRLDPIRYVTLTDGVYEAIKQRILTQDLPLGSRIRDEVLAEQLGVSRTPVREALRNLIRDGLVEAFPRSQTRIRVLMEEDIDEIFDLRIALESLAVIKAVDKMSAASVARLENMHHGAEIALKAGNPGPALEFDREMHRVFIEQSGNRRLQAMMKTIDDFVTLFRNMGARTPAHRGFNYRHKEIIRAVGRQDGEAAAKALTEHILMAKEQTQRDFAQHNLQPKAKSQMRKAKV